MTDEDEPLHETPRVDERQSDATTQKNKPNGARAKDEPKAGNILGGVQPR